jgi:Flp pilus assembly protein TadG
MKSTSGIRHTSIQRAALGTVPSKRRFGGRRGNTLVEFALIMTPFFALTLTTIELALPIFKKSTFESAVRAGCRYGITYDVAFNGTTYGSQTAAIQAVVQANSAGFLSDPTMIHVDYYNSSTFALMTGQPGANADGNILQVSVSGYTHNWIAPVRWFWGATIFQINPAPLTIAAVSADRLESLPPGGIRPSP